MEFKLLTVVYVVCFLCEPLNGGYVKRQVIDFSDDSSTNNAGSGLEALLGTSANRVLTRASIATRAKGSSCTTPQGTQGSCAYIVDSECSEVLRIIQQYGISQVIINYLRQAIQSPCGKDTLDYTMCCDGPSSSKPTEPTTRPPSPTPTPRPTSPPTSSSAPITSICGLNDKTRIVNGQESKPGAWPWAVIVGRPKEPSFQVICGGTLISDRHVLTAAHCFVGQVTQSTHVRLGEHDISSATDGASPEDVSIAKVTTHSGYTTSALQNDIAILTLSRPVEFRQGIRPACLPDDYVGVDLTNLRSQPAVVGWGSTVTGGSTVDTLREAKIDIIPKSICEKDYEPISRIKISDNQICAGDGSKDTCTGDSGGPMLSDQFGRYAVIGITSFGVKCADSNFPGVYTRVDRFLDWISANMN